MFYVPNLSYDNTDSNVNENATAKHKSSAPDYETELNTLAMEDIKSIRDYALGGNLKFSKLRSVYWKILLDIFPPSPTEWSELTQEMRCRYNALKNNYTLDPRRSPCPPDDNPLSQDENSVWYRYFCDVELKRVIQQDVIRTSPERQFFQSPQIQEIMINVLFIYARENPDICYRQGMHEVLALLLYVIHGDCQKLADSETSMKNSLLPDVLDTRYLEHDLFYLFTAIMKRLGKFYESDYSSVPNACGHFPSSLPNDTKNSNNVHFAFDEIEESGISLHVNSVIRNYLAVNDPSLHQHLKKLNIPYTVFGIRWLRLLFGREFLFVDLFVLWDAIFAVDCDFVLVNHILVAMLIGIRNELLHHDYVHCLNQLMNYPKTINISNIVRLALYLKDPQVRVNLVNLIRLKNRPLAALCCIRGNVLQASKKPALLPIEINESNGIAQNYNQAKSKVLNLENHSTSSATNSKKTKPMKWSIAKKVVSSVYAEQKHSDTSSLKNYEKMMAELKHMRVVMSLCKLKLYQYHDILAASVEDDDMKAQHALTGIQELCTLLEIDHFSTKSSPGGDADTETIRETGDAVPSYTNDESSTHATEDAVTMCLPPPKTDISMTTFSCIEYSLSNAASYFPPECPHRVTHGANCKN